MYKSYSYNNMPTPVNTFSNAALPPHEPEAKPKPAEKNAARAEPMPSEPRKKMSAPPFGRLQSDDMILLIVISLLVLNDCSDKLLILALAFIFTADYFS